MARLCERTEKSSAPDAAFPYYGPSGTIYRIGPEHGDVFPEPDTYGNPDSGAHCDPCADGCPDCGTYADWEPTLRRPLRRP